MEVRPARGDEVPQLAAMLARAFHDDPVTAWFMRSERRRPRYATRFFGWQLHRLLGQEHVHVTDDGSAAAVWALPGRWRESNWEALRLFVALIPALGSHLSSATRGVERVEKRHPPEPHLYLAVLGTDPPAQGRGLGSAVLRPGLETCDREGLPAYLESSKESNVGFYSRFGFRVTEEVRMPGGGPRLWLMWREPS
jgi:ribosomal protein S18 acetylase RimI-like enzyme